MKQFTELLEHSNVDKSVIDDFQGWLFTSKISKATLRIPIIRTSYDISWIFNLLSVLPSRTFISRNSANLNLQTFEYGWLIWLLPRI